MPNLLPDFLLKHLEKPLGDLILPHTLRFHLNKAAWQLWPWDICASLQAWVELLGMAEGAGVWAALKRTQGDALALLRDWDWVQSRTFCRAGTLQDRACPGRHKEPWHTYKNRPAYLRHGPRPPIHGTDLLQPPGSLKPLEHGTPNLGSPPSSS